MASKATKSKSPDTPSEQTANQETNVIKTILNDQEILQAILDKLHCLEDPRPLFKEVSESVKALNENVGSLRKDLDGVKKDIELLKQHRLKQFVWIKENLTKIEVDKEVLREDLERRTNALTRCMWMTEGAIRDFIPKDLLSRVPDITGSGRDEIDINSIPRSFMPLGSEGIESGPSGIESGPSGIESGPSGIESGPSGIESGPSGIESGPSTVFNTPDTDASSEPVNGSDYPGCSHLHSGPSRQVQNAFKLQDIHNALPTVWPKEDNTLPSRLTASVMSLNSRIHDLEKSQGNWRQLYMLQVDGLKNQVQQVQQENSEIGVLIDDVMRMKKIYEEEDKTVDATFMNLCADLVARINGRVENLEKSLEKGKNGDFRNFAKNAIDGMTQLSKTQSGTNDIVRKSQQIADERKFKKVVKAMKEKEEHEIRSAVKFAQLAMGGMRANNKAESTKPPPANASVVL
ncbi:hypothetical protein DFH27DRAFT_46137 [Peziza echinospora]|nr:hypothetical protein DFH27DRAFT_46137 [Peziza echinospora]